MRAELRKKFLKETQKKLEKYQSILDTSILSKLDAHAIEQVEQFKILDQSIKNLAIGLSEGRNTFAQLHAENVAFREHFDRRTEDQAIQRAQQQFKDSLFFPEIFARQEEIHNSHKGTCSWIFDTPKKEQPWASFTEWLKDSDDVYWCVRSRFDVSSLLCASALGVNPFF